MFRHVVCVFPYRRTHSSKTSFPPLGLEYIAAALRHLDFPGDHDVHGVERRVREGRLFSFDIGTESVLSIGGALENVAHGCDGIVNVYPFTCMPGTIARRIPYPGGYDPACHDPCSNISAGSWRPRK